MQIPFRSHSGFFIIIALAVGLRLANLNFSFWLDEAAQAMESARPFSQQSNISSDFHPPLFHYLTHFLMRASASEGWLRLTSVVSGVLSVGFLYRLLLELKDKPRTQDIVSKGTSKVSLSVSRDNSISDDENIVLPGKKTATLGALLLALSPFHIAYSQELRPYALATFFAVLSWWALIQGEREKGEGKRETQNKQAKSSILFFIATVGGLYSMYLYPFIVLSQLAYVLFERRSHFKWIILLSLASGLCFVPWLPMFFSQLSVGTSWTTLIPGWGSVVGTPQLKALPLVFAKFAAGTLELKKLGILQLVVIPVLLLSFLGIIKSFQTKAWRVFLYWFLIPLLGSWLVSFFIPVIQPKRLLIILPAFVALLAFGLSSLKKPYRSVCIGFVLCLELGFSFYAIARPENHRENWKPLVAEIEQECSPLTCGVVFAFNEPFAPWQWYSHKTTLTLPTGKLHVTNREQVRRSVVSGARTLQTVYVFEYLMDLTDPNRFIMEELQADGWEEQQVIDGKAIGFVRVFAKP